MLPFVPKKMYENVLIELQSMHKEYHRQHSMIQNLMEELEIKSLECAYLSGRLRIAERNTHQKNIQFSNKELKILRTLVHPDKHSGSKQAEELFKKVNNLYEMNS